MDDYRSYFPNRRVRHRSREAPAAGRTARSRRSRWLLLAVAVLAIAAGAGTGHAVVLAAGLALAPAGLHVLSSPPASGRSRQIRPMAGPSRASARRAIPRAPRSFGPSIRVARCTANSGGKTTVPAGRHGH